MLKLGSIKKKVVDALASHPKATTVGAGLAVAATLLMSVSPWFYN